MKYPNFSEEKKLWKKGYKVVVGLDEAGRGPLAGPVIAAAVTVFKNSNFTNKYFKKLLKEVNDSKKLSPKKRNELFEILIKNPAIEWGIGRVSEIIIDKINILEATKLAMLKAIASLEKKLVKNKKNFKNPLLQNSHDRENSAKIGFLLLDGNFRINSKIPQKSIIKADGKVFSCAAASIIAKVTRDRIMQQYHKKYPEYCFDKHKGYPTKLHRRILKKHGPSVIHRLTFNPVKKIA